jgi:hypothetical protein
MKSKIVETLIASLGTLFFLLLIIPFFLIWIPHRILLSPEYIYRFDIGIYRYFGLAPIALGAVIYLFCSGSFVFVGKGTPIPFTPSKELIVTGFWQNIRQHRPALPYETKRSSQNWSNYFCAFTKGKISVYPKMSVANNTRKTINAAPTIIPSALPPAGSSSI